MSAEVVLSFVASGAHLAHIRFHSVHFALQGHHRSCHSHFCPCQTAVSAKVGTSCNLEGWTDEMWGWRPRLCGFCRKPTIFLLVRVLPPRHLLRRASCCWRCRRHCSLLLPLLGALIHAVVIHEFVRSPNPFVSKACPGLCQMIVTYIFTSFDPLSVAGFAASLL